MGGTGGLAEHLSAPYPPASAGTPLATLRAPRRRISADDLAFWGFVGMTVFAVVFIIALGLTGRLI